MKVENARQLSFPGLKRKLSRWSPRLFILLGLLALGYVGLVLADATLFQAYQTWRFNNTVKSGSLPVDSRDQHPSTRAKAVQPRIANLGEANREGSVLGKLEISAIGLEVMILEGTQDETLRRAVGHIPGTAFPGETGNVAIAGHRDTFFKPLRNIRKGDEITLTTMVGSYRYSVDSTKVVEPENIEVLNDTDESVLTLVTCYPFQFIGSAPQRFIVRGRRLDSPVQSEPLATQ